MVVFILQISFLILFSFPNIYGLFLWKRALWRGKYLLDLYKMDCGLLNLEEFEKMNYILIDWDTMVLVEYKGQWIRMTEFERLWVWPGMSRKDKELQLKPVDQLKQEKVKQALPDGEVIEVWTAKAKYNAGAIENEKRMKAQKGGRI